MWSHKYLIGRADRFHGDDGTRPSWTTYTYRGDGGALDPEKFLDPDNIHWHRI